MEVCNVAGFSPELLQNHTNLYHKPPYPPVSVQNDPDWQYAISARLLGHNGTQIVLD